jgi:hypothetical protein
MLKPSKLLSIGALLFTTISLVSPAIATDISILGSYKGGGGHTLDLDSSGDYHSCDAQNRCFTIAHAKSSQQGNTRIWKHAGSLYQVTPVGQTLVQGHYTRISVRIISPQNKKIFDRILRSQ